MHTARGVRMLIAGYESPCVRLLLNRMISDTWYLIRDPRWIQQDTRSKKRRNYIFTLPPPSSRLLMLNNIYRCDCCVARCLVVEVQKRRAGAGTAVAFSGQDGQDDPLVLEKKTGTLDCALRDVSVIVPSRAGLDALAENGNIGHFTEDDFFREHEQSTLCSKLFCGICRWCGYVNASAKVFKRNHCKSRGKDFRMRAWGVAEQNTPISTRYCTARIYLENSMFCWLCWPLAVDDAQRRHLLHDTRSTRSLRYSIPVRTYQVNRWYRTYIQEGV